MRAWLAGWGRRLGAKPAARPPKTGPSAAPRAMAARTRHLHAGCAAQQSRPARTAVRPCAWQQICRASRWTGLTRRSTFVTLYLQARRRRPRRVSALSGTEWFAGAIASRSEQIKKERELYKRHTHTLMSECYLLTCWLLAARRVRAAS